jgi:DNA-binding NtrC family response regulator
MRLTSDAVALLEDHDWPGNLRELRNVVIQAAVLSHGTSLDPSDFRLNGTDMRRRTESSFGPTGSLESLERRLILETLDSTGGHQQRAAAALGISRRTLSRKLKYYQDGVMEAAS